ncbi:MAG: formamidopyrimidine-DNA glycosylase [Proteobacteria bacterium]|nr:formamidopyrimidine-DNA glycosylase [Pseudomonadota bacterium]
MPELPDITAYLEALEERIVGQPAERVAVPGLSLLRSVDPAPGEVEGRRVAGARRLGKRVVLEFEDDLFFVFHLMIAGRFHWKPPGKVAKGRRELFSLGFSEGTLTLTEAGTKRRASLHVVRGAAALAEHDPGGLEVLECEFAAFGAALTARNHTLKRALTDPHILSGIGNAYSDEILHHARLSPVRLSQKLSGEELERLFESARETLNLWVERLCRQRAGGFPEKVTAFRDDMAVHGRYGKPCPVCDAPVQRIVYASNETNYCAPCQTGGRLLADRALSRLLKKDWPRSLEELEARRAAGRAGGR